MITMMMINDDDDNPVADESNADVGADKLKPVHLVSLGRARARLEVPTSFPPSKSIPTSLTPMWGLWITICENVNFHDQGVDVLLAISSLDVEEGGKGEEKAFDNRPNHCHRLNGGGFSFSLAFVFFRSFYTATILLSCMLKARWYCNKSCFYGGDIGELLHIYN